MDLQYSDDESRFLEKLQSIIENNMSDPDLDVSKLLRMIGMSRTDLHRKLSQAVSMSTTEYMRHLRLQKAASLLVEHPEWSIYQVALEVGFRSHGYFTSRFREYFGTSPVEFREYYYEMENT